MAAPTAHDAANDRLRPDLGLPASRQQQFAATGSPSDQSIELTNALMRLIEKTPEWKYSPMVSASLHILQQNIKLVQERLQQVEVEANDLQAALAIAKRDAEIDHLTGLANRRAFESEFSYQFSMARAAAVDLCLGVCDVDKFKAINDECGHETGDLVIRAVAAALGGMREHGCYVARYGGDEFVIIFRGAALRTAAGKLGAVEDGLRDCRLSNPRTGRPVDPVLISAGLADALLYDSPASAMNAADEALYRAKREGGGRYCFDLLSSRLPS